MRVIVLGGGVSGLSCGVRLLEAGYPVDLWARELSPDTTSRGAGGTLSWGCAEEGVSLLARARRAAAHVGPIANPSITGSSDGT
ncbi:FAD-dependent oxidoreductase [Cystobacter fuscus]|nr:FAD-dependent oxidoreductase [Cystobacter fuscus]